MKRQAKAIQCTGVFGLVLERCAIAAFRRFEFLCDDVSGALTQEFRGVHQARMIRVLLALTPRSILSTLRLTTPARAIGYGCAALRSERDYAGYLREMYTTSPSVAVSMNFSL